ncbi:MAG: SAM-dependent methyltransferase [Anaerolineae bacterium]
MSRFIIHAATRLYKSAMAEFIAVAPDARKVNDLLDGAFLVESARPAPEIVERLVQSDPTFIKHLMPVHAEIALSRKKDVDLPRLLETARQVSRIAPGQTYAVQCRCIGVDYDYDSKDVEIAVGRYYEGIGALPTFSDFAVAVDESQVVISIYLYQDRGYLGFSTARENLNDQLNEYRIVARRAHKVNRAEYKLQEALRKFKLDPRGGRALDLGAAPGGWTQVLADHGMQVVAVDPGELDPRVAALPNVTHFKCKADAFVSPGDFDLLVDDMNVEPEESAGMMVQMAPHLKPGGYAILTVKLVIKQVNKLLNNIRPVLETEYDILRIKHLFHNRQEVTLLLRRKS